MSLCRKLAALALCVFLSLVLYAFPACGSGHSVKGGAEKNADGLTSAFCEFLAIMEDRAPVSRTETGDDGYFYSLARGTLVVSNSEGTELWRSESTWWVDDFRLGDVDGDGIQDFLFSLWKSYRFGAVKPTRMENDDETVRNHLFLYTAFPSHVKAVWCSSDLPRPVYLFELDDTGVKTPVSSGMTLLTQEGEYRDDFSKTEAKTHKYEWQGFGFVPY